MGGLVPSPSMGEGWGEGEENLTLNQLFVPLTPTLSRQGRGENRQASPARGEEESEGLSHWGREGTGGLAHGSPRPLPLDGGGLGRG
jgi:hypothetical protein